jgi:membrane associated rhomboid family serine protease
LQGIPEVWQLLTYGFLHAVRDPMHIVGNVLMLWFFGSMLQAEVGPKRFVLAWFGFQLAGGLVFLVPVAFGLESPAAIGASGAAYGVMAACATLHPDTRVLLIVFPLRLQTMALGIVALTVFAALLDFKEARAGSPTWCTWVAWLPATCGCVAACGGRTLGPRWLANERWPASSAGPTTRRAWIGCWRRFTARGSAR